MGATIRLAHCIFIDHIDNIRVKIPGKGWREHLMAVLT